MILNDFRQCVLSLLRLALVSAMVLCLALTAKHLLSYFATSPEHIQSSFRIQVREAESETPPTDGSQLRLDELLVDGRRLRYESTERSPNWAATLRPGSVVDSVAYNGGPEGGSVSFTGANFLLFGKARAWSGMLEVQCENRDARVVDVQAPPGGEHGIMIEEPRAPVSESVLNAAVVLFTLAALTFAPWRSDRRVDAWLLFFLVTFHGMFVATQPVGTTNDSRGYLDCLPLLGEGYPTYFPPGYPALLGLIRLISSEENLGRWIVLVQHTLAVVAAFWTYSIARRLFPLELALLSGILAGTLSPINSMSQTVMSEMPTLFAMVGALYFGLRAAETGKYGFAVLAGALTGWGGLLRAVPLVALLPAIGVVLLFSSAHRKIRLAAITVGVAGGIMLAPVAWFAYKTGKPTLAESAGHHLHNRVVYEQKLLDETGPATQTLLKILDGEDPRQFAFWDLLERPGFKQLPPEENEYSKVEKLLFRVSREAILKNPLAFLSYTPRLAWRELVGDAAECIPSWGDTRTLDAGLETPPPLRMTASGIHWRWRMERAHRTVWPILCWAAIIGALLGWPLPQRGLVLALVCVPACYVLASASLDIPLTRHSVPTIPFVVLLSIVPLRVLLLGWAATARATSPEPMAVTGNCHA